VEHWSESAAILSIGIRFRSSFDRGGSHRRSPSALGADRPRSSPRRSGLPAHMARLPHVAAGTSRYTIYDASARKALLPSGIQSYSRTGIDNEVASPRRTLRGPLMEETSPPHVPRASRATRRLRLFLTSNMLSTIAPIPLSGLAVCGTWPVVRMRWERNSRRPTSCAAGRRPEQHAHRAHGQEHGRG